MSLQIEGWAKHAYLTWKLNHIQLHDYNKAKTKGVNPTDFFYDQPNQPNEKTLWDAVIDEGLVFKPSDFVKTLEQVPDDDPKDSLCWDDINAHYTNTAFKLNPQEYSAIDSTFTVVGTKCRVIICNIPNVTRLAKNIKDNCTFEVFIGKNRLRMLKRIYRLPGLKSMEMNLFKVDVEAPSKFDIFKIPTYAWNRYEAKRIELAKEALNVLKSVTNMQDLEGYLPILDAVKVAKEHGMRWGIASIQQWCSRGVLKGQKINNELCVSEESLMKAIEAEKM
jgi:hypothetical protein